MTSIRQSFFYSFTQKYSELVISFLSTLVLARLLTPEEVGLFSIIALLSLLAHMIRDFGVSTYIVQEKELNDEKLRSAQAVTMISSFSMGLLFILFNDEIYTFYNREEVKEIAIYAALNFFIIPFGSVSLGLLRRDLKFKTLLKINISSTVVHSVSAIFLAYSSYSYMSLVWASILGTSTGVLLAMFYSPRSFVILPGVKCINQVFRFGGKAFLISIITELGNSAPELLTGKFYNMHNVGLLSRANGVIRLFHVGIIQGILPVLLPHYVKKIDAGHDLKNDFLDISAAVCCIAWPFFLFLFMYAESILLLLFGEQWTDASIFLEYLAIAGILRNTFILVGNVFVATRRIELQLRLFTISHALGLIIMLFCVTRSIELLMVSIVVFRAFHLIMSIYYLKQVISISFMDFINFIKIPFFVTCISIIPVYAKDFVFEVNSDNWITHLLISGFVLFIFWLFANHITTSPISKEVTVLIERYRPKIN